MEASIHLVKSIEVEHKQASTEAGAYHYTEISVRSDDEIIKLVAYSDEYIGVQDDGASA